MFVIVVHTFYYKWYVFDSHLSMMENDRNNADANNENKKKRLLKRLFDLLYIHITNNLKQRLALLWDIPH